MKRESEKYPTAEYLGVSVISFAIFCTSRLF